METLTISQHTIFIPLMLTTIAGLATVVGSLVFFLIKNFKNSYLVFCLGLSAGAMLYVSFVELLTSAITNIGFIPANLGFITGIIFMMAIDFIIPHKHMSEKDGINTEHKDLYPTGILLATGIAIHNFPEGMAVFISSLSDPHLGTALAIAIAAHNIPEGIAIAMPIYYSTRSKGKAFLYSFFSGIAEPLGAILMIVWLGNSVTSTTVDYLFAFVAGIMVFICFDELLPQAFKKDYHRIAISGILTGMLIMIASLSI